jgi:N-methylhydantoinase B
MPSDPITIQVIANALKALIYEMDAAIERTSMSIIIREQHDFGMSLVDDRGWVVTGTAFSGQTLADYARDHPVAPGDVVVFNDPFLSYGEISHLGDTMIAVPVFWEARLIAWGIAWGHHMDMGAAAPASMPSEATEIYHEGLQIPPVKLFEQGELDRDLLAVIARNSRTPEMMTGDLLALSAAGKIAEKRMQELCGKFGLDAVLESFAVLFGRARETMRRLIEYLPDGKTLAFRDHLDNDGRAAEPLTIAIALTRHGERVVMDFTGTSPQCEGPVNYPMNPSYMKLELYSVLKMAAGDQVSIDAEMDPNQGIEDLVDVIIPDGCFLAPSYPAPVSLRHLANGRVDEVIKGILAQAFPHEIPATHNGSLNCYSLLGHGRTPVDRWLCFEVMAAGSGGRPFADGLDAFSWNTRLKNAPAEFVETVYPVRIEQYSLRPNSAGPGKFKGGDGLIRAIRSLRPSRLFFLDDRHIARPWGLYGGLAAEPNDAWLERADGSLTWLPSKFDGLRLNSGDMFVMRTGGGGGWGDPFERDPELVARDVRVGLLTAERARAIYGVVLSASTTVDADTTQRERTRPRPESDWVDLGTSVPAPGPLEFRPVAAPPEPWLVVPRRGV